MNRSNFYFGQPVTEAELDQAFDDVDEAFASFLRAFSYQGIVRGAEVTPNSPANLTVVVGAGTIYDQTQRHIEWFTNQIINCAVDELGQATAVTIPGQEKWLSIFAKYDEVLSQPVTDEQNQTIYYRRTESYRINVVQGAQSAPTPTPPPLRGDQILLCDILLAHGQTQITSINFDRAEVGYDLPGTTFAVRAKNLADVLQQMLDALNSFNSDTIQVPAVVASPHGTSAGSVTSVVTQLLSHLNSLTAGLVSTSAVAGSPNSIVAGTVQNVFSQVLGFINNITASTMQIAGISSSPNSVTGASVQNVVQQLLGFINAISSTSLNVAAISDSPLSTTAASITSVLTQLLAHINDVAAHLNRTQTFTREQTITPGTAGDDGLTVTGGSSNRDGIVVTGGGNTGRGIWARGGATGGAAGHFQGQAGSDSNALFAEATGAGAGIRAHGGPNDGPGVLAIADAGGDGIAVDAGASGGGSAVKATNVGTGYAVEAISSGGHGMHVTSSGATAVHAEAASGNTGVYGECTSGNGIGVHGDGAGTGSGVKGVGGGSGPGVEGEGGGTANQPGVKGTGGGTGPGVFGLGGSGGGVGVSGQGTGTAAGVAAASSGASSGVALTVQALGSNSKGAYVNSASGIALHAESSGDEPVIFAQASLNGVQGLSSCIKAFVSGGDERYGLHLDCNGGGQAALHISHQPTANLTSSADGDIWVDMDAGANGKLFIRLNGIMWSVNLTNEGPPP